MIEHAEIERIKREMDLVALVRARGLELKRRVFGNYRGSLQYLVYQRAKAS